LIQCRSTRATAAAVGDSVERNPHELYTDRIVAALVARLDRRVAWSISVSDRELYISIGAENLGGRVVRLQRGGFDV
jgi:hypothetical protein